MSSSILRGSHSRSMGSLCLLLLSPLLACGGGETEPPPAVATLEGRVTLATADPIPSGSTLHVSLLDVTVPGEPGLPLSSMLLHVDALPADFALPYGEGAVRHLHLYGLEARVDVEGETLYRTSAPIPLFHDSTPTPLVVILQPEADALWWDPESLALEAAALDARRSEFQRLEGEGRRGGATTRWVAWLEGALPVIVEEQVDHGDQGAAEARYHLREGDVFRYEEVGERWAVDLSGAGRRAPSTLLLSFDPEGGLLAGIRTRDGARTDLSLADVEELRSHIPTLLERIRVQGG